MDTIRGIVSHIVFRNEENAYTIFIMDCSGEEVTCVGTVPEISEGESLRADGSFVSHPVYGRQLKVSALAVEVPQDAFAMERYLGSGAIKGIGLKLAARIVRQFGDDTFRIMEEEPERLAEVKGITARKAADIYQQFHARQDMREAMMYLAGLGISLNLSYKIYRQYGKKLYEIMARNPYRLAEEVSGVGFAQADEIARNAGIGPASPFRICSGIQYVLQLASRSGHTCIPEQVLEEEAAKLLGVSTQEIGLQLQSPQIDRKIIRKKEHGIARVYLAISYYMEMETAAMLLRLNVESAPAQAEAEPSRRYRDTVLNDDQMEAVKGAVSSGVMVLTGGPGTGKTTAINAIIRHFEQAGCTVELAAPTGRAAKRMEQACAREARTIHRLLEVTGPPQDGESGSSMTFERNEDNPLEADVVIIDEMSMIDLYLMHALLKALVPGTHLVLVGDCDQLPSVGPGRVLGDILSSGLFPVVNLTRIFRQALESDIVKNAHLINEGKQIPLDNKSRDFFCIRREDVNSILGLVVALVRDKLPGYVHADPMDIQVLTPMRKGELGAGRLNRVLQQYLNPPDPGREELQLGRILLREGDKVMQIRNNYQIEWEVPGKYGIPLHKGVGVFNGDLGRVSQINHFSRQVTVRFDEDRVAVYGFEELDELDLAYAVTVHKSQGSEYPAVVMPLLSGPQMLMNRNILYTAVTRAKNCVVIVGSAQRVEKMILSRGQQERFTGLALRLKELSGPAEEPLK